MSGGLFRVQVPHHDVSIIAGCGQSCRRTKGYRQNIILVFLRENEQRSASDNKLQGRTNQVHHKSKRVKVTYACFIRRISVANSMQISANSFYSSALNSTRHIWNRLKGLMIRLGVQFEAKQGTQRLLVSCESHMIMLNLCPTLRLHIITSVWKVGGGGGGGKERSEIANLPTLPVWWVNVERVHLAVTEHWHLSDKKKKM